MPSSHSDTSDLLHSLPAQLSHSSISARSTNPPDVNVKSTNGGPSDLDPRAASQLHKASLNRVDGTCDGGITVLGLEDLCIMSHAAIKLVVGDLTLSGCLFANFAIGGTQRSEQQRASPAARPDRSSMQPQDAPDLEYPPMKTITSQSLVEAAFADSVVLEDSQFVRNTFNSCYIGLVATGRYSPMEETATATATAHTFVMAENTLHKICPVDYYQLPSADVLSLTATNVSLTGVRMSGLRVLGPSISSLGVYSPIGHSMSHVQLSGLWASNCSMHTGQLVSVDLFHTSAITTIHMADNLVSGMVFYVDSDSTVIADAVFLKNLPLEDVTDLNMWGILWIEPSFGSHLHMNNITLERNFAATALYIVNDQAFTSTQMVLRDVTLVGNSVCDCSLQLWWMSSHVLVENLAILGNTPAHSLLCDTDVNPTRGNTIGAFGVHIVNGHLLGDSLRVGSFQPAVIDGLVMSKASLQSHTIFSMPFRSTNFFTVPVADWALTGLTLHDSGLILNTVESVHLRACTLVCSDANVAGMFRSGTPTSDTDPQAGGVLIEDSTIVGCPADWITAMVGFSGCSVILTNTTVDGLFGEVIGSSLTAHNSTLSNWQVQVSARSLVAVRGSFVRTCQFTQWATLLHDVPLSPIFSISESTFINSSLTLGPGMVILAASVFIGAYHCRSLDEVFPLVSISATGVVSAIGCTFQDMNTVLVLQEQDFRFTSLQPARFIGCSFNLPNNNRSAVIVSAVPDSALILETCLVQQPPQPHTPVPFIECHNGSLTMQSLPALPSYSAGCAALIGMSQLMPNSSGLFFIFPEQPSLDAPANLKAPRHTAMSPQVHPAAPLTCFYVQAPLSLDVAWTIELIPFYAKHSRKIVQLSLLQDLFPGGQHSPKAAIFQENVTLPFNLSFTWMDLTTRPLFYPQQMAVIQICSCDGALYNAFRQKAPQDASYDFLVLKLLRHVDRRPSAYAPHSQVNLQSPFLSFTSFGTIRVHLIDEWHHASKRVDWPIALMLNGRNISDIDEARTSYPVIADGYWWQCVHLEQEYMGQVSRSSSTCFFVLPWYLWVIGASILALLFAGFLIFAMIRLRNRVLRNRERQMLKEFPLEVSSESNVEVQLPANLMAKWEEVEIVKHNLASGGQSMLALGIWRGTKVVVKTYAVESEGGLDGFQREIGALFSLRHPNIVQLVGVILFPHPSLLLPFLPRGSLNLQIRHYPRLLTPSVKRSITRGVVCGMQFLHSQNILHLDLKSGNVLLDSAFHAQITDFGISRSHSNATTGGYMGSVRWMAPEMMATAVHVSPKADVFSFCTVLWELYSLCTVPFAHLDFSYEVCEAVLRGELPVLPANAPQWVHDITAKGWRLNPDERPSFADINQMLTEEPQQWPFPTSEPASVENI